MKIAYIGQKGIPMTQGGIESHVENLSIEMAEKGHDVFVYTRPHYTDKNLKNYKGVNLISLPSIYTKNLDAISNTFLASVHACFMNYDIIHYHGVGPSLLSFIPRLFSRSKIIGTFHCRDKFHKKWGFIAKFFLGLGEYAVCNFPHKTIVVSPVLEKHCKKQIHGNIVYIPNGFKITKDINSDKLESFNIKPRKYFLAVSRLIGHKGLQYFIKAFDRLNDDEYQAVIVGDTYYNNEYSDYIKELASDNKNIIIAGQQGGDVLNQLFTNAYCFVIPSEGEGLSITLLEAMAHGLPVIASSIEGNDMFISQGLVYSFENKNFEDLYIKMKYVIQNYDEASEKAVSTKKYIEENFSWDKVAGEIEWTYKAVINL